MAELYLHAEESMIAGGTASSYDFTMSLGSTTRPSTDQPRDLESRQSPLETILSPANRETTDVSRGKDDDACRIQPFPCFALDGWSSWRGM